MYLLPDRLSQSHGLVAAMPASWVAQHTFSEVQNYSNNLKRSDFSHGGYLPSSHKCYSGFCLLQQVPVWRANSSNPALAVIRRDLSCNQFGSHHFQLWVCMARTLFAKHGSERSAGVVALVLVRVRVVKGWLVVLMSTVRMCLLFTEIVKRNVLSSNPGQLLFCCKTCSKKSLS